MNLSRKKLTILEKALDLNMEHPVYGSIAEIGAGQEVARHFFEVGGTSKTVAKTISAYDMQFSDAIYGKDVTGRYVTRTRVESMLNKEFRLLVERVSDTRPADNQFFAFADTVAAKAYKSKNLCQGWMGIKFQAEANAIASQIVLHVNLLDDKNLTQQKALGTLGVNLVYAAFHFKVDPKILIESLFDNLTWGSIEVDFIEFSGPAFSDVDNREMMLHLVKSSLTPVVMFGKNGKGVLPTDIFHGKDLLILRGLFRPFTNIHEDMINSGIKAFAKEQKRAKEDVAFLCEMNIAKFVATGEGNVSDLLARVEMITKLGYDVMITSHFRYFRISEYFARTGKEDLGFVLSFENIHHIFNEDYYAGFSGGILTAMGKLFTNNTNLFVYPNMINNGNLQTIDDIEIEKKQKYLFSHLLLNRRILSIDCSSDVIEPISGDSIFKKIKNNDETWKSSVPVKILNEILELERFI